MSDILEDFDWEAFERGESKRINDIEQLDDTSDDASSEIKDKSVIEGTVISINKREVVINIGYRTDGIVPFSEFSYNPALKVGDTVDVYVEIPKGRHGLLYLSHKKARQKMYWERAEEAYNNNETIKAYVKCRTKGGTIVDIFGIEAFMPGSQTDIVRIADLNSFVDKIIEVKIVKMNEEYKNIVVSRKAVIEENLAKKKENKTLLRDIWQKHTEVQEQILRQRATPINIIPEESTVVNEKLYVRVDDSDNTEYIKNKIAESLELNDYDCHFDDGYVLASLTNWEQLDDGVKARISSEANREYVTFTFNPIVDGTIVDKQAQYTQVNKLLDRLGMEYSFDKKHRLQISIEDLTTLKDNPEFKNQQLALPDVASAIITVYPSILGYLEKLLPNVIFENHQLFKFQKRRLAGIYISKQIAVEGGFLKDEILEQLNPIFNLRMCKVEFKFTIHENALELYDWKENKFGLPRLKDNCLTFTKTVKNNKADKLADIDEQENLDDEDTYDENDVIPNKNKYKFFNTKETNDIGLEYYILNNIIKKLFGEGNYDVSEKYFYEYREDRTWASADELDRFKDQLRANLDTSGISIAKNGLSIGIDFNWKERGLPEVLTEISEKYPFVDFGIFKKGHKCNFDIQFKKAKLTDIKNQLHVFSDELLVEIKKDGTELYFSREFQNIDDLLTFKTQLAYKLQSFDNSRYLCSLTEVPANKVKLAYFNDITSRDEDRLDAARELKGADFMVDTLKIGKLIRIANYPDLIFDISGDNYEITKQLFEESDVTSIEPDLSGDLEKLARLKESLNRIVEERDIENPSLGSFIFDASKAAGIKDFDESIKLELQEIEKHLLNKKIDNNFPQKEAIAKAILAPDLALVQGPPGTGKSTAIAELIWQHVRENPDTRLLLTSETNLAVDNAIDRVVNPYHNLVKPIRIGDESRLETEGLQFSYSAMYRWAIGEDIYSKKKSLDIDDEQDDEDLNTDVEDTIYETPDKLILLNWMENIGRRINDERMPEEAKSLWLELLSDPSDDLKQLFFDNYISNCNVIGATCSSIGQKNIIFSESIDDTNKKNKFVPTAFYKTYRKVFSKRDNQRYPKIRFDVVIQDESSKATPAELSLPLIYGKKNIIIGDHRQLPPMLSRESFLNTFDYLIKREKIHDRLQRIKELRSFVIKNFKLLEVSHFERLYNQIDINLKGVFNYQFRMHPAINEVIKQFYIDEGGLECGLIKPKDLGIDDPDFIHNGASRYHGINAGPITPDVHVLWIDTSTPEMLDGTSRVNYGEVQVIKKLLEDLNASSSFHEYNDKWLNNEDKQIGLISFYGKQLRLLRNMAREFNKEELPIRISTVDRFQGMERNIIIVSMVRSNCIQTEKNQKANFDKYPDDGFPKQNELGFAQSPNRLNVALSRAKRLLIIVGNSKLFRTKDIYNNVYNTVFNHENGKIIEANEYGL